MKKIKTLFNDKLLVNFLHIFSGDAIASILSIFSISFITKGIGVEKYGYIVLLQGITGLFDGVFNFQSWQGVIKFYPSIKDDEIELKKILKFSYFLDFITAILAFFILFISQNMIVKMYNFSYNEKLGLIFFSLYILFNIQGTPIGILRSFNKFEYLRNQRIIVGCLNFFLLGIGYFLDCNLIYFIVVYFLSNVLSSFLLNFYAKKALKERKIEGIFKEKLKFNKEFFKFTCLTNINSSLDIPVQYLDNLLVGKLLSFEQLGIYKIAKTLTIVLDKIGTPIYQTLYPYFCEKVRENNLKEILKKTLKIFLILTFLVIVIILGMNLIGFYIFSKVFTESILSYKLEINLYLIFKSIATIFIMIHPLFLAMGYIRKETKIIFISNIIYLLLLFYLIRKLSLIGVIIAYGIQVLLIITLKLLYISKNILKFV